MKLNLSKENKSVLIFVSLMVFAMIFSVVCIYATDVCNSSVDNCSSVGLSHQADLNNVTEKDLANDTAAVTDNGADKTAANDSAAVSYNECSNKLFDSAMSYDTVKFCNPNREGKISDMYITYAPEDNSSAGNNFTMSGKYVGGSGYHWIVSDETYGVDLVSVYDEIDHPERLGSTGTTYFNFNITNHDDYFVKLLYVDLNGNVIDELDSDMLN